MDFTKKKAVVIEDLDDTNSVKVNVELMKPTSHKTKLGLRSVTQPFFTDGFQFKNNEPFSACSKIKLLRPLKMFQRRTSDNELSKAQSRFLLDAQRKNYAPLPTVRSTAFTRMNSMQNVFLDEHDKVSMEQLRSSKDIKKDLKKSKNKHLLTFLKKITYLKKAEQRKKSIMRLYMSSKDQEEEIFLLNQEKQFLKLSKIAEMRK